MNPGVYLYHAEVQLWYLRWIGFFLGRGTFPVHTCVYVKLKSTGYCFRMELTSDPPTQQTRTVGRGDGYTIQITRIEDKDMKGELVEGCCQLVAMLVAENYASTQCGDLNYSSAERDWFDKPQGYGGPMFDRYTCNTFTYYVLRESLLDGSLPPKPKGAMGWGLSPKFPGPTL
jgi:hypothetical protein